MTRRNCDYFDHNIDDHGKDDVVIVHDKDNFDYLDHDIELLMLMTRTIWR